MFHHVGPVMDLALADLALRLRLPSEAEHSLTSKGIQGSVYLGL